TPDAPALGALTGDLGNPTKRLLALSGRYERLAKREVLPVFELVAVVGQGAPGVDGMWRRRMPFSVVDEYLRVARQAKALLLLDIQPGRSDFLSEAKHFDQYLRAPDVGLALDPEWDIRDGQRMGESFGRTSGKTIDAVAAYLSEIVSAGDLPEKVLVYHRVTGGVVEAPSDIVPRPGIAIVQSVDGIGSKAAKRKTYDFIHADKPRTARPGIKLFFEEDTRNGGTLMTPEDVLGLAPVPEYVMYE
ncbi:MAG TPA: hypothetical protein VM580_26380, partial [Labilithrix sp.]|nr:hypothetical protein [Labilithrix sp.]